MAGYAEKCTAICETFVPSQPKMPPNGFLKRAPAVKIITLTASMDEAPMMGVLRAGAVGYIRKDAEPETLLAAVRAVAQGELPGGGAVRPDSRPEVRGAPDLTG